MKTLAAILGLVCAACTSSSLESGGWVPPSPQKSNSMEVVTGGFTWERGQGSMNLFLMVDVKSIPSEAKFLRFVFPDPQTRKPRETRVIRLAGAEKYDATSDPMNGLKRFDAYPVVVQLSADRSGSRVLEEVRQHVRCEFTPAMLPQFGISQ